MEAIPRPRAVKEDGHQLSQMRKRKENCAPTSKVFMEEVMMEMMERGLWEPAQWLGQSESTCKDRGPEGSQAWQIAFSPTNDLNLIDGKSG